MKSKPRTYGTGSKALFTIVGGAVLINPVFAQEASTATSGELEEVIVTGMRGSLEASMDIKREAIGVVDAISAEDIGKFPDTNLAESLQRIPGISIDRRNGEGSQVTARGFGAQFNMVTLNGRQLPGAEGFGNGDVIIGGQGTATRSFNFANLASESIRAVEVFKTGRADIATGGIGATIDIVTARPFDQTGNVMNIGAKALSDTTNRVGDDVTPELSGLFSFTNDDRTLGASLSASYQKRDSGSAQSTVNNWNIESWSADPAVNRADGPFAANALVENAPAVGQLYGIPNDIRYAFSDIERERINAQAVVQFSPADSMTLTLDYTFAQNDITEDRGEQTVWLQRNGFTHVIFDTDEAVATPVFLQEMTGASKDFGYEQQHNETRNRLGSLGFNANWDVSDRLNVGLDYHTSKSEALPNDGTTGGSQTAFSMAGKVPSTGNCTTGVCTNFWTQEFQFNNGLPIAGRTLYPTNTDALAGVNGNSNYAFDSSSLGSQVLRVSYQEQVTEIDQLRLDGTLEFDEGRLQFGVETREMDMTQRTSGGYMGLGDWGVGDVGNVPDMFGLLVPQSITGEFNDFNPAGAPTEAWRGNANTLGLWGVQRYGNWSEGAAPDGELRYNPGFNNHNIVGEDTTSFYVQFAFSADVGTMPANLVVGARYEATEVTSTSHILPPRYLLWQDDNDFQVNRSDSLADVVTVTENHNYDNILPNLDFDIGLMDTVKGRFSYSKTIARANYANLTAAVNPNGASGSTLNGLKATADANNPGLLPLESTNMDLSLEWYFSDSGYVSVGWWNKDIKNFIGNSSTLEPVVGLGGENILDQTAGPRAQAALAELQAQGYGTDDSRLFTMMAMMENAAGFTDDNGIFWPGGAAAYDDSNAQHVAFASEYDLIPRADDPDYVFSVQRPINSKEANIHGWEFGGQYFLGDTGFGILANYTIVEGDVEFDPTAPVGTTQFALLGLSDTANAVLMYEKYGFSVRLAYNWRDEFLANNNFGNQNNPIFVEEYEQLDLSIGYDFDGGLAVSLEAINLTEEDVRWHGRSTKQVWRLEDQGARYALGARYKF
jgi:TonB-dependent receptor